MKNKNRWLGDIRRFIKNEIKAVIIIFSLGEIKEIVGWSLIISWELFALKAPELKSFGHIILCGIPMLV
jgi:hypothetical protein